MDKETRLKQYFTYLKDGKELITTNENLAKVRYRQDYSVTRHRILWLLNDLHTQKNLKPLPIEEITVSSSFHARPLAYVSLASHFAQVLGRL